MRAFEATAIKLSYVGNVSRENQLSSILSTAFLSNGPRQANLVFIAYASSEGSGEPAHPRSLARTSAARSYKH